MSWSPSRAIYNGSANAYNRTRTAAMYGFNGVMSGLNKTRKAFASLPSYVKKLSSSAFNYMSGYRSFFKLYPNATEDAYQKIVDYYLNETNFTP
jgi:hypothetical protein